MLIATFGPTTGWTGKSITYQDGQFVLEGHGPISDEDVMLRGLKRKDQGGERGESCQLPH